MSTGDSVWRSVESWRTTAFTVAGVAFAADLTILLFNLASGTQEQYLTLGQGLIGTGWVAVFLGLLGFYPSLAERSRWLPRIGGVFAVVGLLTNVAMAVVSYGLVLDLVGGELTDYTMYFLPGMFLGIVLGCGLYGVASLRTEVYRRPVGLLFLALVVTFLFNLGTGIAGFNPLVKIVAVVAALTLANLGMGYLLGTGSARADRLGTAGADSAV
jgi:hypothetical protein